MFREMPLVELKDKYRKLSSLEKARRGWEDEYEVSLKQVKFFMIIYLAGYADEKCTGKLPLFFNVIGHIVLS